jgi:ABC-type polysaccharide/polyol phosphate transport system ATPase subunit
MIDVRFDRVSKRYRLRQGAVIAGPRRQDFWAVRDVSFEVARGETLGVIGHNGAGKSTLLKLLSRITAPTSGTITLHGRLAALIEVGSGFHPELSGRENIFLSGSILGMRRREIAAKLDRIVDFSGVGAFIDMPVKWYSSGMYVRLGFSVAAHLEADILLVDEVLAVGDAAFQVQCYDRIAELRRSGTTLLFISHDLASIDRLCDRVLLMNRGRLAAAGPAADVVREYQRLVADSLASQTTADAFPSAPAGAARVLDVRFAGETGAEAAGTTTGGRLTALVDIEIASPVPDAVVELFYYSRDGRTLHCQHSTAISGEIVSLLPGRRRLEFTCDAFGLQPGIYSVGASIRDRHGAGAIDWWYGTRLLYVEPGKSVRGYFFNPHAWRWADAAAEAERHPADV